MREPSNFRFQLLTTGLVGVVSFSMLRDLHSVLHQVNCEMLLLSAGTLAAFIAVPCARRLMYERRKAAAIAFAQKRLSTAATHFEQIDSMVECLIAEGRIHEADRLSRQLLAAVEL